ncbi:hypothetical protein TTHERM_00825450 (macronuclear) [Tetrahymena thermophila SB210]|uniref:Uncharacterized protein n=1 Tax=Tetrahymena thermophila (strain SB210) TaxID=312017 RepID=I7LZE8_TETTS|nr:hypothetical protein TTHERM_00825450 [Tetrahymena thermophila SB210]EAR83750.2 hypothetical protein TTHERM_00825450 [Tetrahymena thermophila SB210]|eukprot:XP_001031413.2 hypothetical protein TTHERM_00825450 [Tetrahymena thermophila SB210]
MEDCQQRISKISFNNCERSVSHSGNLQNMLCVDKECIGVENQYLSLMCDKCVQENIHQKQNHVQKPFQNVMQEIIKELLRIKQENDKTQSKFKQIRDFIDCLESSIVDENCIKKTNQIYENFQKCVSENSNSDQALIQQLIHFANEIEFNDETNEISLKNKLNQTIDSDNDSNIAYELFKDFEKLIDIFNQNNHQFDYNIILPLQAHRLLSEIKESPLGSIDKEKLFKDAFRIESNQFNDQKRASGSRRQSLEMFEADKKILLLMNENDRLNFSLNAKQDEIDILKIKLQRAEEDLKKMPSKNQEEEDPQIKIFQFELERVNKALEYKNKEIETLYQKNSSKIAENGETIIELQAQIDMLVKENERLNSVIAAKDDELGSIQSISNLEDKTMDGLKAEIIRQNKIINEQNAKIESIKNENKLIIDSKHLEANQQKEQYSSLFLKYSQFESEIKRMNSEIQQKNQEIEELKRKFEKSILQEQQQQIQQQSQQIQSPQFKEQQQQQQVQLQLQQQQQLKEQNVKEQIQQILNPQHNNFQYQQQLQQVFPSSFIPLSSQIQSTQPNFSQFNTMPNSINAQKLFNNYGNVVQQTQNHHNYLNRERLGSEGQGINQKLDSVKSASHIKKISAIDRIDIYKKNDYLTQPLSSRFKSPPSTSSGNKANQMNLTQTTVSVNEYEVNHKNSITPTISRQIQSANYHVGAIIQSDRKQPSSNNNLSHDDKISSLSSSINYYKTYKQNSQFNSPPTSTQSIIPYKERIDSKIQNLSKEIGKLNNILDKRDQPEKKQIQQVSQNFIKQQTYRSGSESLKNKVFK